MERIIHTFDNGLRVVAERSDGNVAYIGILIDAGSRDDGSGRDGLAHFVEHTLFKATTSRNSWQLSNRMESVGGELNAYTTKEEIMIYTNAPAGYEVRAIELLADLLFNAQFPEVEINRERGVILEEIHSYHDNPSYAVFDEFEELFYRDSPLAHNILGYPHTVENLTRADALSFRMNNFRPDKMVMYCVAPSDPKRNLRLIEKYIGSRKSSADTNIAERKTPPVCPPFEEEKNRDNHQANVLLGTRLFDGRDPRRYALFLLSNILAGPAMNSRLSRELRDRRGLVYTVESIISLYSDCGSYGVYFGCEPRNVRKCTDIIHRELQRFADKRLGERQFESAKRQYCGQLLVSGDNRENCAMGYAKSIMRFGEIHDNSYAAQRVMELTAEELREMAALIVSRPMSRLILT